MHVLFICPGCRTTLRTTLTPQETAIGCGCGWSRPLPEAHSPDATPTECLVCGTADLWRRKDFPQRLGLAIVAIAIVLSTIAVWYDHPFWGLGILMAFALADWLLYILMKDVLVCYRCHARHRPDQLDPDHPRFDLELAERYRQEAIRLEESARPPAERTQPGPGST